mmetsp:Transcript_30000/g.29242  ORF Transcript_30000/g.29242 Transcript_30000/m.29242 type:complete len:156 (+) Transcript_30000:822-1289(+)
MFEYIIEFLLQTSIDSWKIWMPLIKILTGFPGYESLLVRVKIGSIRGGVEGDDMLITPPYAKGLLAEIRNQKQYENDYIVLNDSIIELYHRNKVYHEATALINGLKAFQAEKGIPETNFYYAKACMCEAQIILITQNQDPRKQGQEAAVPALKAV